MFRIVFILFMLFIITQPSFADLKDFHFIPQRRRVVFVEDYYKLYRRNLHQDTATHLANIYYLKLALKAAESNQWWIHPTKCFAYVRYDWGNPPIQNGKYYPFRKDDPPFTQAHHAKYRELMKMRICLLLTESYLKLGSRYDKANIYWFNSKDYEDLPYIKRKHKDHYLKRGFRIARTCYTEAQKYWNKTKEYARICWEDKYKHKFEHENKPDGVLYREIQLQGSEMPQMEDEVYKIYHGGNLKYITKDIDYYEKVVKRYKEIEKDYFNKENYPEFNYDKVIKENFEALSKKEKKLDKFIKEHKIN